MNRRTAFRLSALCATAPERSFFARRAVIATAFALLLTGSAPAQTRVANLQSMKKMSLDELLGLELTTMSRKEELWWTAPGAIEVVTSEEIRRSGAQNIPEMLRLAAGMDVAHSSARSWAVSARGFNVLAANKISVLLDGRSLFTPFFSGVQWDAQDTLLEDVDRVEVVRGPVGALWGSFAVNGFIQIITKPADATQGLLASAGAGTEDPGFLSFRYGGKLNPNTFYRVYAKYFETDWTYRPDGQRAEPSTDFFQSGFRVDSALPSDTTLTFQGDAYTNKGLPQSRLQTTVSGANVLGHLKRSFSTESDLDVSSYFDYTHRVIPSQWEEVRRTSSLTAKYRQRVERHDLLTGFDAAVSSNHIGHLGIATFDPDHRTTHNVRAFVQDTIALVPGQTSATMGFKGEHNRFSGFEFSPSVRGAWTPTARTTVWGAVSRAVRPPVRIDQDLLFGIGTTHILEANDDFKSETVIAYELGWRHQLNSAFTWDIATFYNDYDRLRSTEPLGTAPLPLTFKNGLRARSHGAEITAMCQPLARLFFKLSYRYLDMDFRKAPGSLSNGSYATEANDPLHLATLSAHATLRRDIELDGFLRYVSDRPAPFTKVYTETDLRLRWSPPDTYSISVTGRNLFTGLHRELNTTNSLNELIGPSYTVKVTLRC